MDNTQCLKPNPDAPPDGPVGRDIRITKTTAIKTDLVRLTSPLTLVLALDPILKRITAQIDIVLEQVVGRREGTALLDSVAAAPVVSTKAFDTGMMKITIMEITNKVHSPMAYMEGTPSPITVAGTTVTSTVKLLFLLQCLLFFIAIWALARESKEWSAKISLYTLMMKTVAMLIVA